MAGILRRAIKVTILGLCCLAAQGARAGSGQPSLAEGDRTSVPYGWVDFCNRYAGECDGPVLPKADISLTPVAMKDLEKVNRSINTSVTSVTDMEHWGIVDRWDYPTDGKGDCEDYALMKRRVLLDRGYPRQALLMTVVKDHEGEGHAILTVKTNRGDYVLDNLSDKVERWDETGYRFMKRQSQEDPNRWVSLGAPGSSPLFTAR